MKKLVSILIFGLILFAISSCKSSNSVVSNHRIQKRKYTKGWFIKKRATNKLGDKKSSETSPKKPKQSYSNQEKNSSEFKFDKGNSSNEKEPTKSVSSREPEENQILRTQKDQDRPSNVHVQQGQDETTDEKTRVVPEYNNIKKDPNEYATVVMIMGLILLGCALIVFFDADSILLIFAFLIMVFLAIALPIMLGITLSTVIRNDGSKYAWFATILAMVCLFASIVLVVVLFVFLW